MFCVLTIINPLLSPPHSPAPGQALPKTENKAEVQCKSGGSHPQFLAKEIQIFYAQNGATDQCPCSIKTLHSTIHNFQSRMDLLNYFLHPLSSSLLLTLDPIWGFTFFPGEIEMPACCKRCKELLSQVVHVNHGNSLR